MWSNRNVWILLGGEFFAGLGLWSSIIANLEFMQRHIPSDFMKSLVLFVGLLAGVLAGPFAGKIIDSYSKKKVLIYAGFGRLISVCFMFLAIGMDSVWWMVMFAISLQIASSFYFPALQAVIPRIVNEKDLLTLNGVHVNVGTLARILGTTLAGILLVTISLSELYVISFGMYVILLISTFFLDIEETPAAEGAQRKGKGSGSFKEIWPILKGMPVVIMMLCIGIVPTLFIGSFNLMVINISELQNDPQIKGLLYAVEGIAFIVAAFLVKRVSGKHKLLNMLFVFAFFMAIAQMLLFFADIKVMSLLAFGLFGFAMGCFFPLFSTYMQTAIPKDFHGRFFSFRSMLDRVLFQVVLLSAGFLLDAIGLKYMVLVFGSVSLVFVVYAALRSGKIIARLERANGSAS
ncbi:MFS transporter [Paenibacillus sp. 481]|uniref:MFS transporter n=1 Tax=Paenibacillus sp. 481 TaxID=2835869 RepID=UPI001E5AC370|nr:MFS transporter [Paenibacillus sp. 481]UHA73991.1 MFS transporter [Paenibacillus sp. 481]